MSATPTFKVTIIAVGVSTYQNLAELPGAVEDVTRLRELLVVSPKTALFSDSQFIEVIDPSAEELRSVINDYVNGVSNHGEILFFYFSGHGAPIGRKDFGFFASDTVIHEGSGSILPFSVLKFSDLLHTINISNITPIIVIDACYSGLAGHALEIQPTEMISTMKNEIHSEYASKYALLTSCTEYQTAIDTSIGGIFSHYLIEIAMGVIPTANQNKQFLNLHDIFPYLEERVMSYTGGEVTPRLYLGAMLPEFHFVKNASYSPRVEMFAPYLVCILQALLNKNKGKGLSPSEILKACGEGAYGNHNKLSLGPWSLVETNADTGKRILNDRGKNFLLGKQTIPRRIQVDQRTEKWVREKSSDDVSISDFPD